MTERRSPESSTPLETVADARRMPPRLSIWQRAEATLASLHWFGLKPRCAQCGLQLGVDKGGLRQRCFVDPNAWASRCEELGVGVTEPFACPHLAKAAQLRLPARP